MSGHSKWSTIKHKKGATDAKRGKIFTKITREITVAAKIGGKDLTGNFRLRKALEASKEVNMPKDNIDRAIKKGTGELEGVSYEEIRYEGYGPGGVAILVDTLTDNKNRTVAEVRSILSKGGGNFGETGSVNWIFDMKGLLVIEKKGVNEDQLMEIALEAGAEDFGESDGDIEIKTSPHDFELVKEAVAAKGFKIKYGEVTMVPQNTIKLEGDKAKQMLRLIDNLEDNDDVQKVYTNFDIDESELEDI
ncbi:MAG: YebC/PmpR family DNA-binding transcriptional regulator [Nitrospinota bacterium]|nr:YebC/PmpR family DNA-binding transcriptional regulator [Nitrospinota bacterium]